MIRGLHGLIYSSDAEASRAFLRDKLRLPFSDVGEGWLIFDLPEADLGVHPTGGPGEHGSPAGTHDVSFYCDDIKGTVADLKARGVTFQGEIADHGYGWVTYLSIPGGITVQLYEPKYQKRQGLAADEPAAPAPRAAAKPAEKPAKPPGKTNGKKPPAGKKAAARGKKKPAGPAARR